MRINAAGKPVNVTASGIVFSQACVVLGVLINSTSSGTLVLRNGTLSGSTAVTGTITPAAGQFIPLYMEFSGGMYCTVANTIDVTFMVQALNTPIALARNG
jgi:hypothetical protein